MYVMFIFAGQEDGGGGLSFRTYLALGARHALVARVLRLARWTLAPHGNGNAGVGEYQHQQRHDELQREQGQRVVVILSTLWPNLAANVSDGTARTHNDDGAVTGAKSTLNVACMQ